MYIIRFLFLVHLTSADDTATQQSASVLTTMCIKLYWPKDQPLVGVTTESSEGLTWPAMEALCRTRHPGYGLAPPTNELVDAARTLCPNDRLLPVKLALVENTFRMFGDSMMRLQKPQPPEIKDGYVDAMNWESSQSMSVSANTKFRCAVCKIADRTDVLTKGVHPPHNNSIYAYDLELVSNDRIDDLGLVANGSEVTNRLLCDLAEAFNISVKALRWHGATLNENQKAVVHVYYEPKEDCMDWFFYVHWNDQYLDHKTVSGFTIPSIKLNTECLRGKGYLQNTKREHLLTGEVDITLDVLMGTISTRECYWDDTPGVEAAVWSPTVDWWIVWGMCDATLDFLLQILTLRGPGLVQEWKTLDIELAFGLQFFVLSPLVSMFKISTLVGASNMMMVFHSADKSKSTASALLAYSLPTNIAKLYLQMLPHEESPVQLHRSQYVNALVAVLDPVNPVAGMAVSTSTVDDRVKTDATQLNRDNMSVPLHESNIVVTVSESITLFANNLQLIMYGAHLDLPGDPPLDSQVESWMSLVQVAFTRNVTFHDNSGDDFVDIAFKPAFRKMSQRGKCAERMFATDEWYAGNCRILKSSRDEKVVCRCTNLTSPGGTDAKKLDQEPEMTIGTYLIYGFDASLSTYLANNLPLIIVIVFVGVMSAVGLLFVILTAVFFPEWREDQGHKIFLHMIFALTVNLVLGFVNNFISVDTRSIACIGIGVVRHYSFLAMFVWMMTLSGLQLKRLTTIAGAKGTSHLILKVALIAWGVPLIPIVILLAWDTGFYKSEVSNRGYCYPEGLAFQATVQAPVGVILIANMTIFVFILNHIYGWVKCNKDVAVRKHTGGDGRAEQLRRLCTTIFIFFLFGFTWVFHFLSEEGIINSEFLFEFMFLITASFHLFMLSLFFILLDKKTRELWRTVGFGCKM